MATRLRSTIVSQFLPAFGLAALALCATPLARGQGCVAIKQMGDDLGFHGGLLSEGDMEHPTQAEKWSVNVSYLHFRSHRHYVGSVEQTQRYTAGSEVMNIVDQFDTAINYKVNPRTTVTLGIPYFSASRTSLYEHDRVNRYKMTSRGLGDIRLTAQYWLWNPAQHPKGNIEVGFGFKFPTGDTNHKDYAHTTSGLVLRNVDQSIQPGDGGFGYIVELQAYRVVAPNTTLYATGFYLLNPKETNGTRTNSAITSVTAYMSVADQFQARLGATQQLAKGFSVSLGGRVEGVPALDVIGGNRGFRRPGYVISVEPGVSYTHKHDSFSLSVPWAVYRNRTRSYADRLNGGHGDAAFADFLISFSYSRSI